MTGPHGVYTAQPELLGFQSCRVGLRDPMWTVSRAGKRAIVPASPKLGAQASYRPLPARFPAMHAHHPWFSSCCWLLFSHLTDWNAEPRKHAWQASGHIVSNWHSWVSSPGLSLSTCGDERRRGHVTHKCAICMHTHTLMTHVHAQI